MLTWNNKTGVISITSLILSEYCLKYAHATRHCKNLVHIEHCMQAKFVDVFADTDKWWIPFVGAQTPKRCANRICARPIRYWVEHICAQAVRPANSLVITNYGSFDVSTSLDYVHNCAKYRILMRILVEIRTARCRVTRVCNVWTRP